MVGELIAKLIELAQNEMQSDLAEHEIEDRLLDNLLGKDLNFTTEQGIQANVTFYGIGQGKKNPSTVVTLQVEGIEFEQDADRLTLDLRYVFYQEYGHKFCIGRPIKFLITSPFVQFLGPENILIRFAVWGNTVHKISRCLPIFANVIREHQSTRHQSAVDLYENKKDDWDGDTEISLEGPIQEPASIEEPIEHIYATSSDENYIEDYIKYIDNTDSETRELIDNRNTFAQSKL